ncbi:MAG: rhodanese-like domain-containing protein [Demequinaceae bacterium]|nr:rhodanese-like domain-containing protein [Demequinaceae bacterium]
MPFDGSQVDVDTWAGVAYEEGVVILDVRTPEEFADGHIAGATNINLLSGVFADEIALLNPEASYAVYCRSGNRSREAIDIMADLGVTQTLGLEDGIGGWAAAGYAIVTD